MCYNVSHAFRQRGRIASSASAGIRRAKMSVRLSVHLSVRPSYSGIVSKRTNIATKSTKTLVYADMGFIQKFQKGSHRARALNETGVGLTYQNRWASIGLPYSGFQTKQLGYLHTLSVSAATMLSRKYLCWK